MVLDKFRAVRLLEKPGVKLSSKGRVKTAKKPHLQVIEKPQFHNIRDTAQTLTDQQLISCCAQNKTSNLYWGEFYRRFNYQIDKKIIKSLHEIKIQCTTEIADEISFILMEKIHGKNILEQAVNHPNIRAWLATVTRNIVFDWNKARKTQKNAFGYETEKTIKSRDDQIGGDMEDITLGETIPDPETNPLLDDEVQVTNERITRLLQVAEALPDDQRLVFKVSMMFYNMLSDEDIAEIAALRSVAPAKIKREVETILNRLVEKNEQYEHQQNLMAIKFAYIERRGKKLHEMEKDFNTPQNASREIKKEIADKTKQLENLRRRAQKIDVYPTVEEVAQLLGIPKAKQKNVAVWLHRARQKLKKIREL